MAMARVGILGCSFGNNTLLCARKFFVFFSNLESRSWDEGHTGLESPLTSDWMDALVPRWGQVGLCTIIE
jgi:hypothetical protein